MQKHLILIAAILFGMAAACKSPTLKKTDSSVPQNPSTGVNDILSIEIGGTSWSGITDLSSNRFTIIDIGG